MQLEIFVPVADNELLGLDADPGAGPYGACDEDVGSDDRTLADDRIAAQDRGTGVDGDVVLDSRMTFGAAQALTAAGRKCTDGDALVDLDVLSDDRGLTDDDACAVVHEKVLADSRAGMDIDSGLTVSILRHHPGDERDAQKEELVGQSVDGAGQESGIAQDDLIFAESGGISLIGGLHIRVYQCPDMRDPVQEIDRQFLSRHAELEVGLCRVLLLETEGNGDLLLQVVDDVLDHHRDPAVIIVAPEFPGPVIAGKQNVEELIDNVDDRLAVGLVKDIHVIYIAAVLVILQNPVGHALNAVADIFPHIFYPHFITGTGHRRRGFAASNKYTIFLQNTL